MQVRAETSCADDAQTAVRQCPTIGGEPTSLIIHAIAPAACLQRQREFYHKCHRCDYRGKAADFRIEPRREPFADGPVVNGNTARAGS